MSKEESKPYTWTFVLILAFIIATASAGYIGYWLGTQEEHPSSNILTPAWRTYTDRNLNFSFLHPASWSGEITEEGYVLFKGPADEKGLVPNIIVQVIRPASLGGNYSSYEDAALSMLDQLKTYDNYSLVSYTRTTVSNEPAREIVCSYSYGGLALKQSLVFFQDPTTGYIYMICYTATDESYPEYVGVYEKVKGTFKLQK